MDSSHVIDCLSAGGWRPVHVKGSHHKFVQPDTGRTVTVAHPRKDIPRGTLRSIYRQAGWEWREECFIR